MKISYSILTHNEDKSLQKLLEFLVKHKDEEDEIVILDDFSDNPKTIEILDVMTWGWNVNEKSWVNFPDYQGRIWRNRPNILWKNKVHEVLKGYKEHTYLPAEEQFAFYHPKTIDRQEKQNKFYDTI